MKRRLLTVSKAFRLTPELNRDLNRLADHWKCHPSDIIRQAVTQYIRYHAERLTARGYHRVIRVARTIADLAGTDRVARVHIAEALSYRRLMQQS